MLLNNINFSAGLIVFCNNGINPETLSFSLHFMHAYKWSNIHLILVVLPYQSNIISQINHLRKKIYTSRQIFDVVILQRHNDLKTKKMKLKSCECRKTIRFNNKEYFLLFYKAWLTESISLTGPTKFC